MCFESIGAWISSLGAGGTTAGTAGTTAATSGGAAINATAGVSAAKAGTVVKTASTAAKVGKGLDTAATVLGIAGAAKSLTAKRPSFNAPRAQGQSRPDVFGRAKGGKSAGPRSGVSLLKGNTGTPTLLGG